FLSRNVGTTKFWGEIEARAELNATALQIIRDAPLFGVGLNNYSVMLDDYDFYGFIFPGYPVHNLFLLVFAEMGLVGLLAQLAALGGLMVLALRLARNRDPLLGPLGVGASAALLFFAHEELTSYGLRYPHPPLV